MRTAARAHNTTISECGCFAGSTATSWSSAAAASEARGYGPAATTADSAAIVPVCRPAAASWDSGCKWWVGSFGSLPTGGGTVSCGTGALAGVGPPQKRAAAYAVSSSIVVIAIRNWRLTVSWYANTQPQVESTSAGSQKLDQAPPVY